jgi:predicted CXXCH cytochrome family protein
MNRALHIAGLFVMAAALCAVMSARAAGPDDRAAPTRPAPVPTRAVAPGAIPVPAPPAAPRQAPAPTAAPRQAPPRTPAAAMARPTTRTNDCTLAGCHAQEKQFKFQHGPVAVGACDTCHTYANEKQHTFTLKAAKAELCTFCHIGGGGGKGPVVHKPVTDGDCLGCHNPHGGATRAILRREDTAALCADCHRDVTQGRKHLHGPVASGSCLACHGAHRAAFPKLLAAEGKDLCLSCHDQMQHQIETVKVVHKPVQEGNCNQCHETHASDYKMQLKQEPLQLCQSCHEPVKKQLASAAVKHSATVTGDACLNCHTSHGGNLSKLMKAEPAKACLSCHDKDIKVASAAAAAGAPPVRVIPAMKAVLDPKQFKHGPLKDGDCAGCHQPHGGEITRLLAKPYTEKFYQPFDVKEYALCFTCHDQQLVLAEKTGGLTNFRNGEQNLHYLHVNKAENGRTCSACHSTHTSSQPLHLRETVPFGKWEMPVSFTQTQSGGNCKAGCHEPMAYDRLKPVQNRTLNPAAASRQASVSQ